MIAAADDTREIRLVRDRIEEYSGVHIPDARLKTLAGRLHPRLNATGSRSLMDYYYLLKHDPEGEMGEALGLALNHETYFFREVAAVHALAELAQVSRDDRRFRVLSAGCSSGEEPYTIAMYLTEVGLYDTRDVDIVAFDLCERTLDKGREARYGANSFRSTQGRYMDWYFQIEDGLLRIDESFRKKVRFSQANVLDAERLAEFGAFDAILFRNVMVYFAEEARKTALRSLGGLLRPGGHLFLGHSESPFGLSDDFEMVEIGRALAYRKPTGAVS